MILRIESYQNVFKNQSAHFVYFSVADTRPLELTEQNIRELVELVLIDIRKIKLKEEVVMNRLILYSFMAFLFCFLFIQTCEKDITNNESEEPFLVINDYDYVKSKYFYISEK